jgi:TldD protein
MTDGRENVLDAMNWLLDTLESESAVSYAEVGSVYQEKTDLVVTGEGPRDTTEFTETGVWLRVFADGAADYRYTNALDEESLRDVADRAIRSG